MNTIYDGSFVLGNTNELTFSAGPGIKIDQPSEGVLRIGNDETVLWSGEKNWWDSTAVLNLYESVNNFDVIRIRARDDWELCEKYFYIPSNPTNNQFDITLDGVEGSKLVIKSSKYIFSGNQIGLANKFAIEINTDKSMNVYTDRSYVQFKEVIGINRKEV